MSDQYHIARGSEQFGPYTLQQIDEYLAGGTLQPTDLAWTEGQAHWVPLSQLRTGTAPVAAPVPQPAAMPGAPPGAPPGALPGMVPGAVPGAIPGMVPGVVPGAPAAGKKTSVWIIRGVGLFLLLVALGLAIPHFVVGYKINKAGEKIFELQGQVKLEDIKEITGRKPAHVSTNDKGNTEEVYVWKVHLWNRQLTVEYEQYNKDKKTGTVVETR